MGDRRAGAPEFAVHADLKEEVTNMTAREFIKEYVEIFELEEEKMLFLLDSYLVGTATIRYSEFPDADLPEEFLQDGDEPAAFEQWLEGKLGL